MAKLSQYRIFVSVVETGSIAQAAQHLNCSAPAASKQLMKLEEDVQVQLFHRAHKKLEITEAGRMFYPKCKAVLQSVECNEAALSAHRETVSGNLSITLSKALCRSVIFDVLSDFADLHPEVRYKVNFGDELDDLYDNNLDFAFRLGNLQDSNHLIAIKLRQTQLRACATPDYINKYGYPQSFTNLKGGRFVLMPPNNASQALKDFFKKEQLDIQNLQAHVYPDNDGVYHAVRAGMGVGFFLDLAIEDELKNGQFIPVLPERNLPSKPLYLMYKKDHWQSNKHHSFKEFIKNSAIKA